MNAHPLISVITVCLNSEKTIRTTIESVLAQTYDHYEYVIKDGGSTDSTLAIVQEYADRFQGKLKVISEKDHGIYEAMNQGIQASEGEMIGIINSDDFYSADTLQNVAEFYGQTDNPLCVLIGDMERVDENGNPIFRYHFTQSQVERKQCFGHPSMFAAKAVYDRIGLYDTSYKLAADGDWQYRAMEDEAVTVTLHPAVFNHMREGGASDNRKYRWKWFHERARLQLAHKRGNKVQVYWREFKKVLVADVKAVIPKKMKSKAYSAKYR